MTDNSSNSTSRGEARSFPELVETIREFTTARNWDRHNTPRNLALAICGEAGELAATLQWLTEVESDAARIPGALKNAVTDEMADVLIYLIRMADAVGVDLIDVATEKMERNQLRFPAQFD